MKTVQSILIVIGLGLALAFIASKLFKRVGIPQVVGFMLTGLALRLVGVLNEDITKTLGMIITLALGLIGYNIGMELKIRVFANRIGKLMLLVIIEAILAFWIVMTLVFFVTSNLPLALLLGSTASATAPAATADVIWEHKSKGPVSEALMFILAMDDVIAVILTNAAIAYALFIFSPAGDALVAVLVTPMLVIIGSVAVGAIFGTVFTRFVQYEADRAVLVELELALIILLVGIVDFLGLSDILAAVVFGFVVGNRVPEKKQQAPHMLEIIMSPIVMLFFVLVGAKTDLTIFLGSIGPLVAILALIYLSGRTVGKVLGTRAGARIIHCETTVQKYLGSCLLSQAGVALGLGIIIETRFVAIGGEAAVMGMIILNVVAISTIFLEFIGPIAAKWSLNKAGEITLQKDHIKAVIPIDEGITTEQEGHTQESKNKQE